MNEGIAIIIGVWIFLELIFYLINHQETPMNDAVEMTKFGILCANCGKFIDNVLEGYAAAAGYPRCCTECGGSPADNGRVPSDDVAIKNTKPVGEPDDDMA
jgi:hypothetical protein